MRKPFFCICENKDADQLCGNLCFRHMDSAIPLLSNPKFHASSHLLLLYSPVCVRPGRNPEDRFSHNEAYLGCVIPWALGIYVFLVVSNFGIDGGTVVLIASVPGQSLVVRKPVFGVSDHV